MWRQNMKELNQLKGCLRQANELAATLAEDGRWMRSLSALNIFTECLSLHHEINGLLQKGISRVQAQNATRMGGRF
jgi:phosphoketolase